MTVDEIIEYDQERGNPASEEAYRVLRAIYEKPHWGPQEIQAALDYARTGKSTR